MRCAPKARVTCSLQLPLEFTVLHATERGAPKNRKPIDWKLLTDLPVCKSAEAIEKINWYAMR